MTLDQRPQPFGWPRSQRFGLSPAGAEAEAAYRAVIIASRAEGGRAAYDAARSEWVKAYPLEADDALYLSELATGAFSLSQVIAALETCGKTKADAVAAMHRLLTAGLVAPIRSGS